MSYGLVVKADRYEADKVPKPGKKRVAKWPKRLELKSEVRPKSSETEESHRQVFKGREGLGTCL